jgi:hypothetical protein
VSSNYLAYAKALVRSIHFVDQDIAVFVVVSDGDGRDYLREPNVFCISGFELDIDNWKRFAFQYTAYELACALKPYSLLAILDRDFEHVIYLDSDIYVKASPRAILKELVADDVVLSPHLTSPLPDDGKFPNDVMFSSKGIFNAGFIALKRSDTSQQFLKWWSEKCQTQCHIDVRGGIFVDQLWLNFAPVFFPGCVVTQCPGINAAYWNLHERVIEYDGTAALVNGEPLIFFHFSGFDIGEELSLSRHQNRYRLNNFPGLNRLVEEYRALLVECSGRSTSDFDYAFDKLSDGTRIHRVWREGIRAGLDELKSIDDPFSVETNEKLKKRLRLASYRAATLREDWKACGTRVFFYRLSNLPVLRWIWSRWVEHES